MADDNELLLEVNDLRMYFPIQKGLLRRTTGYVKAVDGVSLSIKKGETLGLVGGERLRQDHHRPLYRARLPAHGW